MSIVHCPSSYITPPLYRVPFHCVSKPFRQNFIFVLENMTKNEISASKKNTKKNSVKQNYEKFKREYVFLTFVTLILSTHAWNKYLPPPHSPLIRLQLLDYIMFVIPHLCIGKDAVKCECLQPKVVVKLSSMSSGN